MGFLDHKIESTDITTFGVVAAPDRMTGTAEENKKVFDRLIRDSVKGDFNAIIDLLVAATAASELGFSRAEGINADNVQAAIEVLYASGEAGVAKAIEEARVETNSNSTDKVAKFLMAMPLLPNLVVSLVKFMDAHGCMPKLIFEASPFHTSLFLSNMASLGMNYIYHHIYNFGTTSVFFTMGKTEQKLFPNPDGTVRHKRVMPMGIVIDERIAAGGTYARAFACMMHYINNPELLAEKPSEDKIKLEIPLVRTK